VFIGLNALLRARVLGQTALAPVAATLEARLERQLPEGVVTKLLALAFAVRHTASTAEVIALAQRIVAMLKTEAKAPPPSATARNGAHAAAPGSGASATAAGDDHGAPSPGSSSASTGGGNDASSSESSSASTGNGADAAPPGSGSGSSSASAGDGAGTGGRRHAALRALLAADGGSAPDLGDQV
ncbi:MAG: hypothetical protein KDJ70_22770, partial [Candidatus Competibacteraceae bacterium]|nr:hypothetical protein [Candidatus Competibacteraceae bacterium]